MVAPRPRQQPPRERGITLVELLVVLVIGGVLLSGAIAMVLSHIRSSSQLAALLRLQDQCGRVQVLLNHEIQQASQASGGGSTLALEVPLATTATITYQLADGELQRIGPPIDAQGRLVDGEPVEALVLRGVQAFTVDVSNPRSPTYRLTVEDATGVRYSTGDDGGGAHCRVREIS
ncbi:MAG: prepilin-type N-terminal cleavage/methylation domain-containing protein [Cyanobacteriota bacterium]